MIHLNKEQHKFLIRISKSEKIKYDSLSPDERKMANFLAENDLVDIDRQLIPRSNGIRVEFVSGKPTDISISEAGKAYFSERHKLSRDRWIPYIITTVISILALMKSYGFGIDNIFIWCMQLLKQ